MTLLEFLDDVYVPLTGVCDRTRRLYSLTIEQFGKFLGRAHARRFRRVTRREVSVAPRADAGGGDGRQGSQPDTRTVGDGGAGENWLISGRRSRRFAFPFASPSAG